MRWQYDPVQIRDRIKQVLDERADLNPTNVAKMAGLSNSMLHKFLKGETRSMTVENVESVAAALGVNSRWLIFGDEPREIDPKVVHIWDSIREERRALALRALQAFVEDEEEESKAG